MQPLKDTQELGHPDGRDIEPSVIWYSARSHTVAARIADKKHHELFIHRLAVQSEPHAEILPAEEKVKSTQYTIRDLCEECPFLVRQFHNICRHTNVEHIQEIAFLLLTVLTVYTTSHIHLAQTTRHDAVNGRLVIIDSHSPIAGIIIGNTVWDYTHSHRVTIRG